MTNETNQDLPEVSRPDPIATPVVWVVYNGLETYGVYSDPKYAAQNVIRRLNAQYEHMMEMHRRSKTQEPRAPYMLEEGYLPIKDKQQVKFLENPTVEAAEAFILYRTNMEMGDTVFGVGRSTYSLTVTPLPVDAD